MSDAVIHQLNASSGGVPKHPLSVGEVTRAGLVGDGHAKPGIHGGPTRALSLFALEHIEALAAEGHPIAPGTTGENVTTRGLDWATLEPGVRLRLGSDVVIAITSYAAPCRTIAGSFSDGNVGRLNQLTSPGRSRLYAEVVREGRVRPGDAVVVEADRSSVVANGSDSQPGHPRPTTTRRPAMNDLALGYVNLYVTDLARSVAFFEKTVGLALQYHEPDFGYASFDAGPVRLGLAQVDADDPQNAGLTGRQTGLGFVVPDLAEAHAALEARGVAFPMKPAKQPWGAFMAMFSDPDDNVFYLDQAASE